MKPLKLIALLAGLALAGLVLLVLALMAVGASKGEITFTDGAKTLRYWKKVCQSTGIAELVKEGDPSSNPNDSPRVQVLKMMSIVDLYSFELDQQNRVISELSMDGVAPEMLEYVGQKAALNGARIQSLARVRGALAEFSSLVSADEWGLSLLGSLMRNSNEKNPFESVLKEQFFEKTATVGRLIPAKDQIEKEFRTLAAGESETLAKEIQLRGLMQSRFGKEFPPSSKLRQENLAAKTKDQKGPLSRVQIMLDLIGQSAGGFEFEAISEFQTLDVVDHRIEKDRMIYWVDTQLKGVRSGNTWKFRLALVYVPNSTKWQLSQVEKQ